MTPDGTVELHALILPAQANHRGTLFAGQGLQSLATAAFLAARQRAQCEVVMAAASGVDFLAPIPVGHALTLRAAVCRVGRTSMTVSVTGLAARPGFRTTEVLQGRFEMVAVNAAGRPVALPASQPLQETPA